MKSRRWPNRSWWRDLYLWLACDETWSKIWSETLSWPSSIFENSLRSQPDWWTMWLGVICWDRILGGNPNCGTVMREKIRNLPTDERDGELTLVEYLDSIHGPWEIHIDAWGTQNNRLWHDQNVEGKLRWKIRTKMMSNAKQSTLRWSLTHNSCHARDKSWLNDERARQPTPTANQLVNRRGVLVAQRIRLLVIFKISNLAFSLVRPCRIDAHRSVGVNASQC